MLTQTGDDSNTLFSERYQQTYHSTFGALTESMHVFIDGAGVASRLRERKRTRVLEIGFGLGLNCLLCADHAASHETHLDYVGVENDLISAAQLRSLNYAPCLRHPSLVDELAGLVQLLKSNEQLGEQAPNASLARNASLAGQHKNRPARTRHANNANQPAALPDNTIQIGKHSTVTLLIGDATSHRIHRSLSRLPLYDVIFLDAFSPEANPECWTTDFFNQLYTLLTPDGTLATYCVKGVVRRNLQSAGFSVEKFPGPAGKREVLRARIDSKHVIR